MKAQLKETSLGFSFDKGLTFAHSKDVQNTDGSYPWGLQIEWNKQLLDERTWNTYNCYPRTGFILQYVNYDNAVLGQSIHASTYIEPYWGYGKKVSASLKGIKGLAYLTNPYQIDKNPTNQSYSLPISGYVALGLGIHVKLNTQLNVNVYGQYNHISNVGIKDPNKGVNWPTLSVGVDYVFKPVSPPQRAVKPFMKNDAKRKWEIIPYWSSRKVVAGEKSRWNFFGFAIQYTKQIARIE
ncbi:hypothetical protein AEM51_10770 [Bacteroidetes bacterium UKL13-3]|nr:hypothetical protein AEM51_10770 [Bacteroidetes bacterium UKL13-3]